MNTIANNNKKSAKDRKKPVTKNYKGYELTITQKPEGNSTIFIGKAQEINRRINGTRQEDSNKDAVLKKLEKWIDDKEGIDKESTQIISNQFVTLAEGHECEKPSVSENISISSFNDRSEISSVGNLNKSEIELGVEKNSNKVIGPNDIPKEFEQSLNILTKAVERINKYLDKPQPSVASQNLILEKIEYLVQVSNTNKINLDELRKECIERSQIQEKLLQDILDKINSVAQADHVTEYLTNLHNESKNLHTRLDKKIDLQDAEQILELKHKIEESVNDHLITAVSEKIMPVVDILKRKVEGLDTTFSKSVDDLEQRCRQAGLIPIDKLF